MEAINHTHACIREPVAGKKRRFTRQTTVYGKWLHPLLSWSQHPKKDDLLLEKGYPVVQDTKSGLFVTAPLLDKFLKDQSDSGKALMGRNLRIFVGKGRVLHSTIESISWDVEDNGSEEKASESSSPQYRWWTWHPELHNMGVAISVVFFISTIIFFIPASCWYPMDVNGDPSIAAQIFWIQVLQVSAMCSRKSSHLRSECSGLGCLTGLILLLIL